MGVRLYLRADTHHAEEIPAWRNYCDYLRAQLLVQHPDLSRELLFTEWRKLRDLNLTQWQATVTYPYSGDENYDPSHYLEFADSESLLAFQLAWS